MTKFWEIKLQSNTTASLGIKTNCLGNKTVVEHYSYIKRNDKYLGIKLPWNTSASLSKKVNCLGNKTAVGQFIQKDK